MEPQAKTAYKLAVKGLLGGHSGERIGDGRGNAIRTLALILLALQQQGAVEVVDFHGGKAHNAIPEAAETTFATDIEKDALSKILSAEKEKFLAIYGSVDPGIELVLEEVELPEAVLVAGDTKRLLRLLTVMHTGVYAMSTVIPGLVETSANLGVVKMDEETVHVELFPRSAVDGKVDEFALYAKEIAELTGFTALVGTKSPGWKENKDSRLAKLITETLEDIEGATQSS